MSARESSFLSSMAIGDAFGMKYEFVDHDIPVGAAVLFCAAHPTFTAYKSGHYTDDTQMSLANAELLLENASIEISETDFARAWLETFKRDPRLGYSKSMFNIMSAGHTPETFCDLMAQLGKTTGGAAMRSAPFGLLSHPLLVRALTIRQATITHNTSIGINSALAVAFATHFFHHGGRMPALNRFLASVMRDNWEAVEKTGVDEPSNGIRIVRQSLNAVTSSNTLSQVLLSAASQDRIADTDTVCAVAMAIASRRDDLTHDLPTSLISGLENGPFGKDYLADVDARLLKSFPASSKYRDFSP